MGMNDDKLADVQDLARGLDRDQDYWQARAEATERALVAIRDLTDYQDDGVIEDIHAIALRALGDK